MQSQLQLCIYLNVPERTHAHIMYIFRNVFKYTYTQLQSYMIHMHTQFTNRLFTKIFINTRSFVCIHNSVGILLIIGITVCRQITYLHWNIRKVLFYNEDANLEFKTVCSFNKYQCVHMKNEINTSFWLARMLKLSSVL